MYLLVIVVLVALIAFVNIRFAKHIDCDISAGLAKKHFEEMGMDLENEKDENRNKEK